MNMNMNNNNHHYYIAILGLKGYNHIIIPQSMHFKAYRIGQYTLFYVVLTYDDDYDYYNNKSIIFLILFKNTLTTIGI